MWIGLAAAATYFFDPDHGEMRRRQLRMRIQRMRDAGEDTVHRLETKVN